MKKYLLVLFAMSASIGAQTQVAVRNEPRHHNLFENDYVRVLDVWLAPGDTSQYHVHATPSVFIMLTKTVTGSQLLGGQPTWSTSVAGSTWYDSLVTPRIHRVWNEDTGWFHPMDVELVAGKARSNEPVLKDAALQLLFDAPLARGYRLTLPANGSLTMPSSKTGYLLVSLGEAEVNLRAGNTGEHRIMKAGHYNWIKAGDPSTLVNGDHTVAAFELLQMK